MRNIIYFMLIFILAACGQTKYITKEIPVEVIKEVPVEIVKTEYISNNTKDSIFIKDSIDRWRTNDTVFIYKERNVVKIENKKDTVRIKDTIPVITKVEVPVVVRENSVDIVEVNKLYWYQKFLILIGILSIIYLSVKLLLRYIKK